jgi:3',5'-cyclic AMP phosphodiesterase CpdA
MYGQPNGYLQQAAASEKPKQTGAFERIILTWNGNPATSQAVTWRTDAANQQAVAEIARADASPDFSNHAQTYYAATTELQLENGKIYYQSVNFTNLVPNTLYAYRVGNGDLWSEWFQFRTANDQPEPFSFIYFGDAQNNIRSLWSRAIRSAILESPGVRFMIHAGDLVNHGDSDDEWEEWFDAAGWLFAMVPSMPAAGNHEYKNEKAGVTRLSPYWRPQFMLPENGIVELIETVYYIDYQGVRIVVLNSNRKAEKQAQWLERILKRNPNHWTIVAFHHPIHASVYGPDENNHGKLWKPIFEKYNVDLLLQGHEHIYARGFGQENNTKQATGPLYVTSVSGPKMYKLKSRRWMDRVGENMQLFQVISVSRNILHYRAITVTGELYDAFNLLKGQNGKKMFMERIPPDLPERRFQ